ncbi:DUF2059 domain-containing protein [Pseudoduganella armeniaca]|uniref:DUF2059 domain-containing protein n=1 Tax=Pseudoduganella armeniaca TaxID=2072590 RepID=A0A2R4C893_9BURK|nr:DUF2059 domain-containing protein [Pseudoduganella armeniaca]AVR95778.1 hypothetical protein C9I28_08590 [Pseudoduganella armeniaca]
MKQLAVTILVATTLVAGSARAAEAIPPAKQALVNRVLQLWQIDTIGQSMLQAPVSDAVQQARAMLQGRAAPEKRDAAMTDIVGEARKFMEETTPIARASADKLIPTTVAPLLAERFTEEELKQMVAILESPVKKKFEAMVPELQKKLGESVAADTRAVIDPKLKGLQERIGLRLRAAVTP